MKLQSTTLHPTALQSIRRSQKSCYYTPLVLTATTGSVRSGLTTELEQFL